MGAFRCKANRRCLCHTVRQFMEYTNGCICRNIGTIIPSVCVVLEGGVGTLKTVKTAIEGGTPAVIVEVLLKRCSTHAA